MKIPLSAEHAYVINCSPTQITAADRNKSIELNFMVPGHTKFKCDGSFGLIKRLYRKTTVDCVDHIVEVVKKLSTAGLNKAQCYENGKGFQYLDLNSVLGIFFKKLSGLQKY